MLRHGFDLAFASMAHTPTICLSRFLRIGDDGGDPSELAVGDLGIVSIDVWYLLQLFYILKPVTLGEGTRDGIVY